VQQVAHVEVGVTPPAGVPVDVHELRVSAREPGLFQCLAHRGLLGRFPRIEVATRL
jgi:hypothetical protein